MKLIFTKDEEKNISVELGTDTGKKEFSYIELVKSLWEKNELEESEFCDEITEDEKSRLNSMIKKINEAVIERKGAVVEEQIPLDEKIPDLGDEEAVSGESEEVDNDFFGDYDFDDDSDKCPF